MLCNPLLPPQPHRLTPGLRSSALVCTLTSNLDMAFLLDLSMPSSASVRMNFRPCRLLKRLAMLEALTVVCAGQAVRDR